jgi:hypothetical protein
VWLLALSALLLAYILAHYGIYFDTLFFSFLVACLVASCFWLVQYNHLLRTLLENAIVNVYSVSRCVAYVVSISNSQGKKGKGPFYK